MSRSSLRSFIQEPLARLLGDGLSDRSQVIQGSMWKMLGSGAVQVGTLVRLAILSRFLSPADFGIMAIVMLVLRVLDTFTTTGFDEALIQRQQKIDHYYPSVFAVNILRGCLLAGAILVAAPYVAGFFDQKDATVVIQSGAVVVVIRALKNPAFVRVHREMQFKRLFYLELAGALAAIAVAAALAPVLQDVWALLISMFVLEVVTVVGSYAFASWRPLIRMEWALVSDLYRFGRWVVVANVVIFASLQIDNVVVGRMLGASALGLYEMAFRISQLPSTQVTGVISTVMYPMLSRLASDPDRFAGAYLKVVSVLFLVNLVLCVSLVIFADIIVRLMLGPHWIDAVAALRLLAVAGFLRSMVVLGGRVLYALGKPGWDSLVSATRLLVLAVTLVPLSQSRGIEGAATAVLVSSLCILPVYVLVIRKVAGIGLWAHVEFALGYYRRAGGVVARQWS